MAPTTKARRRMRGEIETLARRSLRVRVYAGLDPVSNNRHYLVETVPAGRKAAPQTKNVRTGLLAEAGEKRNVRTIATIGHPLDRYLQIFDVQPTTAASSIFDSHPRGPR